MLLLFVAGCAGQSGTGSGTTPAESPETLGNIAKAEPGSVAAAVASASRSPENRARDRYRHPTETLTFFEIEPDMHVLEIRPGSGWYTEILATYLAETGRLSVGIPSADGPRAKYRARFIEAQQSRPDVFGGIDVVVFDPPAPIELGPDASVDSHRHLPEHPQLDQRRRGTASLRRVLRSASTGWRPRGRAASR